MATTKGIFARNFATGWPLNDYFPKYSPVEERTGALWCPASTRENIAFMESDDDIRYTVLGQKILSDTILLRFWDVPGARSILRGG